MQIPKGPSGNPTVSPSQMRTYGAGGFALTDQEESRGCPRLYKAKYIEHRVSFAPSYAMDFGSLIHAALFWMEEHAVGPVEALDAVFPVGGTPEMYREALDDLNAYLERGASPLDRFATLAVEQHLDAELLVDDEYGSVHMQGYVDWMGIDPEDPTVLHVVDYKTNRQPPSVEAVKGDVQLKAYDWLVRQNWSTYMTAPVPQVVVHLDAIKFRDVAVRYDSHDIEAWHAWASAIVRTILRDEDAKPVLNPGCAWCPVKDDCPAYQGLPDLGKRLLEPGALPDDAVQRLAWRDRANEVRLLLDKAVKEADAGFKQAAMDKGEVAVGDWVFRQEPNWMTYVDMRALHDVLGERFYEVVGASKKAIETAVKDADPSTLAAAMACIRREVDGLTVKRGKREPG